MNAPDLNGIAKVLRRYGGRYEFFDVFADDVHEIRNRLFDRLPLTPAGSAGALIPTNAGLLSMQLHPERGIARFRLADGESANEQVASGALSSGLLGVAFSAAWNASKAKEGLLGGLVLGMLVGRLAGAADEPVERVLALRFDSATGSWRVYDGPLLRWAKRTLFVSINADSPEH